jgi:hypothetical protein
MLNNGRHYIGAFRTHAHALFLTNRRQLMARATQARTKVGYFRSYLAGLPGNNVQHPFCICPRIVLQARAVNEATRPGRGKSGRDEAGRGATRRAGIGWALPTR